MTGILPHLPSHVKGYLPTRLEFVPRTAKGARRATIRRDGYACRYCGRRVYGGDCPIDRPERLTVDHVIPLALGGANTSENMVVACQEHNSAKEDSSPLGDWIPLQPPLDRPEIEPWPGEGLVSDEPIIPTDSRQTERAAYFEKKSIDGQRLRELRRAKKQEQQQLLSMLVY